MGPAADLDAAILRLVARGETRSMAIAGALGIPLRSVGRGLARLADLHLIEQPGRGVWRLTADDVAWGSDAARALLRTLASISTVATVDDRPATVIDRAIEQVSNRRHDGGSTVDDRPATVIDRATEQVSNRRHDGDSGGPVVTGETPIEGVGRRPGPAHLGAPAPLGSPPGGRHGRGPAPAHLRRLARQAQAARRRHGATIVGAARLRA